MGLEVWVGDRNSCNEERTKACDINCVISLLSIRSMTKAPAQWQKNLILNIII